MIKTKEKENEKISNDKIDKKEIKIKKSHILATVVIFIIILLFITTNKEGTETTKIKSTLDRIVEKSDLETIEYTYNVIAKKCKNGKNCNKKSNDIDDFEYVVSCKGKITAGIEFKNVKIKKDNKNKKVIITIPEAGITETNVVSTKFLNGEEVAASELPNARKLCEETILEKSKNDTEITAEAKKQAQEILETFYEQWTKAQNSDYTIEVK